MNNIPSKGDRIRLVAMVDDPDPIRAGQTGWVLDVWHHGSGSNTWLQIDVAWDDGRTLMLASPPDTFEIISGGK